MKSKLNSLQFFRGIAALAVVAYHCNISTQAFISDFPKGAENIFSLGYLGVDFFFVLSGFIIMYAHRFDKKNSIAIKKYLYKRSTRVYLPYWPIGILMLLAYHFLPNFSEGVDKNISLLSTFFLLPSNGHSSLSVAWTLIHEILFYFMFLSFFKSERFFFCIIFFWVILIILSQFFELLPWVSIVLSKFNLEFIFGVISVKAIFYLKSKEMAYASILLGVLFAFFSASLLDNGSMNLRLLFSLGMAFIIIGVVYLEISSPLNFPIIFMIFGNASFSIYLIHNPFLSLTQRVLSSLSVSWFIALALGIILSVSIGVLYYFVVEKNLINFSKKSMKYIINE